MESANPKERAAYQKAAPLPTGEEEPGMRDKLIQKIADHIDTEARKIDHEEDWQPERIADEVLSLVEDVIGIEEHHNFISAWQCPDCALIAANIGQKSVTCDHATTEAQGHQPSLMKIVRFYPGWPAAE